MRRFLLASLVLVCCGRSASAAPLLYVNASSHFGTVDVATGAFRPIGPDGPEASSGLVPGPNGSLLTLGVSGNLIAINPASGLTSVIGPTGLADCTSPASPCGPTSANTLVELGGALYATDLGNRLYRVDSRTGAATLIGPTGIPAVPAVPGSANPDGSLNLFDETLFAAAGGLYAIFDALTLDPVSFAITPVIPAALYRIDPGTGAASFVAPTSLGLSAAVYLNGTVYAFNIGTGEVVTVNLTTGDSSAVSTFDPAAGFIAGATPVPEPASLALMGLGTALRAAYKRRRRV